MLRLLFFIVSIPTLVFSQFGDQSEKPHRWDQTDFSSLPFHEIHFDPNEVERLTSIEHASYISATAIPTSFKFSDFKLINILPNGDKIYQLVIQSPEALGMMMQFENFYLQSGAKLWLYDLDKKNFIGSYSQKDNYTSDKKFMTSIVRGSRIVVQYLEPKAISTPEFEITKVYHYFRGLKSIEGFGGASSCLINAACSESNGYFDQGNATCRIVVTGSNFSGWCSGTLVNNTCENMTPYILTANHCSQNSSISDLVNWEFHFLYQSSTCFNPSKEPSPYWIFKGSTAPAYSGTDNGDFSSDFLLLKLKNALPISLYDFTFVGWDRRDITSSGNIGFHHPQGDIKKVSRSNGFTERASYANKVDDTHWKVYWDPTTNGHSVTEGGSSGSGLLNSEGLLVGTLTGGGSMCSSKFQPDFYGRLFMHWNKWGPANDQRLDVHLDQCNTGANKLKSIKASGATVSLRENIDQSLPILTRNQDKMDISWQMSFFQVNIYDMFGKLIASDLVKNGHSQMDISQYSTGVYLIELVSNTSKHDFKYQF